MSLQNYALAMMFMSGVLFSVMGIFIKTSTIAGVSAFELVLIRAIVQGSIVAMGMLYLRIPNWFGEGTMRWWLMARGTFGGIAMCCYFTTLQLLPLGDGIVLATLYPAFTVIIARIALKEYLTVIKTSAVIICGGGAFLIAQPSFLFPKDTKAEKASDYAWIGYITAIAGSVSGAVVFVLIRRARSAHTFQHIWAWAWGSILASVILGNTVTTMSFPNASQWAQIVPMLLFGVTGHIMMSYAGRLAPAGLSSLMKSSDVLFAYIWEVLIFHQHVDAFTIVGALMIVLGISMVAYGKWREMRSGVVAIDVGDEEKAVDEIDMQPVKATTGRGGYEVVDAEEEEDDAGDQEVITDLNRLDVPLGEVRDSRDSRDSRGSEAVVGDEIDR